jgi:hypothetical protein
MKPFKADMLIDEWKEALYESFLKSNKWDKATMKQINTHYEKIFNKLGYKIIMYYPDGTPELFTST